MTRARLWLAVGGVVVAAGAIGAWFVLRGDGVVAGPGQFGTELAECQDRIYGDTRMPSYIEFVGEATWHTGTAADLHIGGQVKLLGAAGKPVAHAFECQARNGRVLNSKLL